MNIRDAVRPNLVFLGLDADSSEGAIATMARELSSEAGLDAEQVESALLEREELGSTSVGNGFAIPHCKLNGLDEIVVALAGFPAGVDFGDGRQSSKVEFFFIVLSPPDQPAAHLQVLSQIARILKRADLRDRLAEAGDRDAVVTAIEGAAEREGL
ncbi:MAG: PTS sugar transporter subunit IIA [Holophagae bacterium]|jgi:mannitol/fructose-specific phosphotransferase system IIA component (Ntr-type)